MLSMLRLERPSATPPLSVRTTSRWCRCRLEPVLRGLWSFVMVARCLGPSLAPGRYRGPHASPPMQSHARATLGPTWKIWRSIIYRALRQAAACDWTCCSTCATYVVYTYLINCKLQYS